MANVDLTDQALSRVRDAADIVDVVSQTTSLKVRGRTHLGLCPFHREKTPSLNVDRDKGLFYCFGCGEGGDVFKFLMLIERMSFPEAVEHLAGRYGIELPKRAGRKTEKAREDLLSLVEDASEAFHQALMQSDNPAKRYLIERRVDERIWTQYGFGYAPDMWDYLLTRLGRKYSSKQLEEAGLAVPRKSGSGHYDRFRNRLLIPIHNESGTLVGFGGRSLDGSEPKYLNSPESPLFDKSRLLYNMHRSRDSMRKVDRAVLVEGYFDCIALDDAGVSGVVASMGTALTPSQAQIIRRRASRVVVFYDGDPAGRRATLRAAPILLGAGLDVAVADPGSGDDPDTYLQREGLDALMKMIGGSRDVFEFALDEVVPGGERLDSAAKREALEAIAPLLAASSDPVTRNDAVRRVAERLQLEFDTVWSSAKSTRKGRDSEPLRAAPVASGEIWLLRRLLGGSEPDLLDDLDPDLFDDPQCRRIARAARELHDQGERVDFPSIATHLKGEAELNRLSELAFADEEKADPAAVGATLDRMKKRQLDRKAAEIQTAIVEAEREGAHERLDELIRAKMKLIKMK
ncbi:MAG: DNA primase [Acidobacteria bacterium]|nr:DNA primase [Acidobacteriota bacterium]